MSRFKIGRPSPALIIAVIALFVGLGGGAVASSHLITTSDIKHQAVTDKKLDHHAVVGSKIAKGAVKKNKVKDGAVTNSKLDHPVYTAYVNPSGDLVRGNGADKVTTLEVGQRAVWFDTDISECVYNATGRYQDGDGRIVNAEKDPNNDTRVLVRIRDGAGNSTNGNSDFSLTVNC